MKGILISSATLLVISIAATIVTILLVAFFISRRRREQQERARQEYGPEYERAVDEHGSDREAEQELRELRERIASEIPPPQSRDEPKAL